MATSEQQEILQRLEPLGPGEWLNADIFGFDPAATQAAVLSLSSREMIDFERHEQERASLTPEGHEVAEHGSHEVRVFACLRNAVEGLTVEELADRVGKQAAGVGAGKAAKLGWIKRDGKLWLAADTTTQSAQDLVQETLQNIARDGVCNDASLLRDLKYRKLVQLSKHVSLRIRKGPKFALEIMQQETDLTAEMVQSGAWRAAEFKSYNFQALGREPKGGALHPIMKVKTAFREIFFELGFEEMATNRFVESSFWNFDALFVPQQHSARDLQDTFFLSDPAVTDKLPDKSYIDAVCKAHEGGAFGTLGYRYSWSQTEARKLVLRTHTTAVSAAVLREIAQDPSGFRPRKIFSIDRVFRNEAVDATHLAEFYQIEGIIVDYSLTLGDLIGFMQEFFTKLGIKKLRFKPAYNPYTEPSMEIFSYHEDLKKWVEIGNSGMFRPEMLEPMGFPPGVRAHGWGLSLERPTMIKYGVTDIRQLLGPRVNLDIIEKNAAVRLDRDAIST